MTPAELDWLTDDEREAWAERAAIMEYDGGLLRSVAERLAYREIQERR